MVRFIFIVICLSLACTRKQPDQSAIQSTTVLKPTYAKGFEVQHTGTKRRIVLFDLQHPGDTLRVIDWVVPANLRLACLSTTHLSFLQKIGALSSVKTCGFANLVRNTEAKQRIGSGELINLTPAGTVDKEILMSVQPDLFLTYPYSDGHPDDWEAFGIPTLPVSEYLEQDPLGRLEWIRLFGVITGHEHEADSVFESVAVKYLALKAKIHSIHTGEKGPLVFTGSAEGGWWYAPPGNSFVSNLLSDAGATYLYRDSVHDGNLTLQFEQVFSDAMRCDYWGLVLSERSAVTAEWLAQQDERMTKIPAWNKGQVFFCNTAEADYFGDALTEPDELLSDLAAIFYPGLAEDHKPKYFQRLKR